MCNKEIGRERQQGHIIAINEEGDREDDRERRRKGGRDNKIKEQGITGG